MTSDGGAELLKPAGGASPAGFTNWEPFQTVGMEDSMTTHPIGFDKSGQVLYLIDSRGRDTSAMTALDLTTGTIAILAEDSRADVAGAMVHPPRRRSRPFPSHTPAPNGRSWTRDPR